jgi:hypothetical protein
MNRGVLLFICGANAHGCLSYAIEGNSLFATISGGIAVVLGYLVWSERHE